MDRSSIPKLLLFLVFLVLLLLPGAKSNWFPFPPRPVPVPPGPLCAAQFALVNHACAALPYVPIPPHSPPTPEPPIPVPPIPVPPAPEPSVPVPPAPEPLASVPPPVGGLHYIEHMHRHGEGRHEHDEISIKDDDDDDDDPPVEEDCCKWLDTVDDECVCDLLVHLPTFLARPVHEYRVIVGDTCKVTYKCSSRIIPSKH